LGIAVSENRILKFHFKAYLQLLGPSYASDYKIFEAGHLWITLVQFGQNPLFVVSEEMLFIERNCR
jgi:hypothetical protein